MSVHDDSDIINELRKSGDILMPCDEDYGRSWSIEELGDRLVDAYSRILSIEEELAALVRQLKKKTGRSVRIGARTYCHKNDPNGIDPIDYDSRVSK